jgi:U11/U12 small nuclear ribonucleoprotein SNRNP35
MYRSTCFQWGFYDPQMAGSIDGTDLIPHDRALIRAYQSKYKPPHRCSSFFIGHLPPSCTENDLAELFPHATRINLIRDIVTCESKCYAFIDGEIDRKKEYKFNGHLLLIEDVAAKKVFGWKPRRCGGGLGGKKESGQLRFGGSQRPFKQPFHINQQIKQRWKDLEKQRDQNK